MTYEEFKHTELGYGTGQPKGALSSPNLTSPNQRTAPQVAQCKLKPGYCFHQVGITGVCGIRGIVRKNIDLDSNRITDYVPCLFAIFL